MLNYDLLHKRLNVPAGKFEIEEFCGETTIKFTVVDTNFFPHSTRIVEWSRLPRNIGQGEFNAWLKRHLLPNAQERIDEFLSDFKAKGFEINERFSNR